MKTQDIVKYALMAAAAYLAYRWLVSQGMIPDLLGIAGGAQGQLPAGGNGAGNSAGNGQAQQQQTGGNGQQPQQTGGQSSSSGAGSNTTDGGNYGSGSLKEQVWEAAKNEATPNAGLLHFWQWNYYLPGGVAKPNPYDMDWSAIGMEVPGSDDAMKATPLTIDQWWTLVQPVLSPGVSGIQTGMGRVNHWQQQSSRWYGGRRDPGVL